MFYKKCNALNFFLLANQFSNETPIQLGDILLHSTASAIKSDDDTILVKSSDDDDDFLGP